MKSGKWFPGPAQSIPGRREGVPATGGRTYDYSTDPRMGGSPRHQSMSDYDGARPGSAGLQGYYSGQRFPGGRQSEAEQMLQAKRRMAAQRERELRNYHQEQQYNRSKSGDSQSRQHPDPTLMGTAAVAGAKNDRAMSPNTMSEEDRRELIARQHRALYGDHSNLYPTDGSRSQSQDVRVSTGGRGSSPLQYDPFSGQASSGAEGVVQMPQRDGAENTASPSGNASASQTFGGLNETQQSGRTSNSSPGGSPPLGPGQQKGNNSGVAPIGTRPTQAPSSAGGLNKRSTTPLTPSSLSYGFNASDSSNPDSGKDERSTSATSKPSLSAEKGVSGLGTWGANSGVWGSGKNTLAVQQPSVWG